MILAKLLSRFPNTQIDASRLIEDFNRYAFGAVSSFREFYMIHRYAAEISVKFRCFSSSTSCILPAAFTVSLHGHGVFYVHIDEIHATFSYGLS